MAKLYKVENIKIPAAEFSAAEKSLKKYIAKNLGIPDKNIHSPFLIRKSLDARGKKIRYNISAAFETSANTAGLKEYTPPAPLVIVKREGNRGNPPVITGFGPAGIFAALVLARAGVNPIILERGFDVDRRKKDIENFWNNRVLNPESNVQFGEGGAGTFSDGKLTTGIKSPFISFILNEFVRHGAPAEILYEAKPHIGTDLLSGVIKSIREEILKLGGSVNFGARLIDFTLKDKALRSVIYEKDGVKHEIAADKLILAAGHSARDIFGLLNDNGLVLSAKPFSAGVRIEHLQSEINKAMYGIKSEKLPPADYKLAVKTKGGRGVYTFCMCPGGYVVGGSSEENTVVTNGMSYYKRAGKNANSALLVNVLPSDFTDNSPLAGVEFQRIIERKAFTAAGGDYSAPAILVGDFLERRLSEGFGKVKPTYKPSVKYLPPEEYLPSFVCDALREAIPLFGQKIKGFDAPYAVLTGPETRSSSPVRIERSETLEALGIKGIYPCGEGAGYAGGIMSAATDGVGVALGIIEQRIASGGKLF